MLSTAAHRIAAHYSLSKRHKSDILSPGQRKEADMGLTHSLNVLIVGAAFVFIGAMLFI